MEKSDYYKSFKGLKEKIVEIQDEIHKKLQIEPHTIPSTVFGMIHNQILLGFEIFSFYDKRWTDTKNRAETTKATIEKIRDENGARIIEIQKMIFIASMSSFEHIAKEYHKSNPKKLDNIERRDGRIYLRDIIGKSHSIGLISKNNYDLWEGLLNLRNITVHNNAISDINSNYEYPNAELILKEGQMTQGNLLLFPNLMDWMINAIKDWIYQIEAYTPKN